MLLGSSADEKNCRFKERALCHKIVLDFLLQNIPIITAEKRTLRSKITFEYIAFGAPFEIVKY
jgi:hypothetical protein